MDEIRTSIGGIPYNATVVTLAGGTSSATGAGAAGSQANPIAVIDVANEYETVAASQTDQPLGATGAAGDYLAGLLIIPASTSPGAVSIKDGAGSAITVFAGGASSLTNLVPFAVPFPAKSTNGAWKVTTGANVSVVGFGDFT